MNNGVILTGGLNETSHVEIPVTMPNVTDTQVSFVDFEYDMSSRFVKEHNREKDEISLQLRNLKS